MQCGTARIEITPPFPAALFGYPQKDRSYSPRKDKVLDPLQARALYLESGSSPGILLLALDLCIILNADAKACREMLAGEIRLPPENIILTCTHTHSAPLARFSRENQDGLDRFLDDPESTAFQYGKWLHSRLRGIATMAISRKAPVKPSIRETFTGLGYNRRCKTPEGIRHCWNIHEFPERAPVPMEGLRHTVIRFDYTSKNGGVILANVGIHPVVMGKENSQVSGDWPCYARRHIERRMNGYQAIYTMGPGAQVHPWIATQSEAKALKWTGEAIGAEAILLAANGETLAVPDKALSISHTAARGDDIELAALELGTVLVVAVPFELSATLAEEIRTRLNRPVLFLCLSNGWDGYWMSPGEFAEGGYEVEVARSVGISESDCSSLPGKLTKYAH